MKEYKRSYPRFALCGLNCGLCPRYHTSGVSKCPGCGGLEFHLKHPSCAVISCSQKHEQVEYCFQCSAFPCPRYERPSATDSFITYRNVLQDLNRAKDDGIENYQNELNTKIQVLEYLLEKYNDGKKKNFYCLAVNLLNLSDIKSIMKQIDENDTNKDLEMKEKMEWITELFESKAKDNNIELKLRK